MKRTHHQGGFSIVELMIGLTISLVIMASLGYLLLNNTSARTELDKSMQQVENGRYATQLLKDELRVAGYYGPAYSFSNALASLPDPCATDIATLTGAVALGVQGYAQPSGNPLSGCVLDRGHGNFAAANLRANNDILVVRRAQTGAVAAAAAASGVVYVQANGADIVFGTGGSTGFTLTDKSGIAPLRQYVTEIFFVSPCDIPASGTTCNGTTDDSGTPVPTLKQLTLTYASSDCSPSAVPCWKLESLVNGVELFHVEYGVDSDIDGTPDSYVSTPATTTDWSNIVTARIHVLVRNTKTTPNYQDNKSYVLGGLTITPSTNSSTYPLGYKRHLFSETIRLINISGRRES